MSEIRYARKSDLEILNSLDHISPEELEYIIERRRIIVMTAGESIIGWLRYGLFWDNTPFMNMLYFLDGARRQGNGTKLVSFWESEMRALGYDTVMTSTLADEEGAVFLQAARIHRFRRAFSPRRECGNNIYKEDIKEI